MRSDVRVCRDDGQLGFRHLPNINLSTISDFWAGNRLSSLGARQELVLPARCCAAENILWGCRACLADLGQTSGLMNTWLQHSRFQISRGNFGDNLITAGRTHQHIARRRRFHYSVQHRPKSPATTCSIVFMGIWSPLL